MWMLVFAFITPLAVIFHAILPLKVNKYIKFFLAVITCIAALKFQIIQFFGGAMYFAPDVPGRVLIAAGWVYACIFFYFMLILLPLVVMSALKIKYLCQKKTFPEKLTNISNKLNLLLLAVALLLASCGVWNAVKAPEIRHLEIVPEKLPPAADGLRAAVLADLHIDRYTTGERVKRIVDTVNSLNCDTVLILGDMVDGTVAGREADVAELGRLMPRGKVFAIPGNHEYFSYYSEWKSVFEKYFLQMLDNRHVKLDCGIYIAGITDPAAKRYNLPPPDQDKALAGIPADAFVIFLAHRPGSIRKAAQDDRIALQLSGHTHGGMIAGVVNLVVAKFNEGFTSGFYSTEKPLLYVSNGTAIWNGFPIRLGRASEITVIEFKRKYTSGK